MKREPLGRLVRALNFFQPDAERVQKAASGLHQRSGPALLVCISGEWEERHRMAKKKVGEG